MNCFENQIPEIYDVIRGIIASIPTKAKFLHQVILAGAGHLLEEVTKTFPEILIKKDATKE